jgi:Mrp family chromosome partitioning ATPase
VLLLSATAVALWPRTYGTEATFVIDGGTAIGNSVALAGRIEAALLEREELAGAAMDLPPELRSPDPIGRLRAGIRVQSRGPLAFAVEFRGSDPQSVQRIANRLVERAAALVPKLAAPPADNAPELALAARTRAVTEFLTAHPEMTLEQANSGKGGGAGDSGLDALRTEKQQIETHLAATANNDNPYTEPTQDPELLNRRLTELKTTIARREAALKQPHQATPAAVSPELTSQWRTLLADLASAQAQEAKSQQAARPPVTAHVTARAALPGSPLTPNRLVLSIVAALLSVAAAMVAYVLPRKPEPIRRPAARGAAPGQRSDPPPPVLVPGSPPAQRGDPPQPAAGAPARSDAPLPRSDPPPKGSDPPPGGGRPGSEPPGPIAVQRTLVLSAPSQPASNAPPAVEPKRSHTTPGGLQAPAAAATSALADTALAHPTVVEGQARPAAPLFGSRPPPGAGSYSVSSSHPPPLDHGSAGTRTSVERLSPLQSHRPPAQPAAQATRHSPPPGDANAPQIMSRPPALDPEAEAWAARFETLPPPDNAAEEHEPRKRAGRWKTQVMGSMVPLEVVAAREERPPLSEPDSFRPQPQIPAAQAPLPMASTVIAHDVPPSWHPNVDATTPAVLGLRDAVLKRATAMRVSLAVTGVGGPGRAQLAAGLGLALAHSGARVLLVEGDLDTPELHQVLSITAPSGAGFSQQLMARRQDRQARPWVVVRCAATLQVLAEGRMRSPGLLGDAFESAITELREQHHVVLIHAPSLDKPGDLRPIAGLVHGVIVVNPDQSASLELGDNALRSLLQ